MTTFAMQDVGVKLCYRKCIFPGRVCACVSVSPEDAAELREDEEVAEEGMAAEDAEAAAIAAAGAPMETALRPMARLLTGPRPEGAKTVAEPTEEA